MTSNGIALQRKLANLRAAGLDSINLSLDTLIEEKFERITRRKGERYRAFLPIFAAHRSLRFSPFPGFNAVLNSLHSALSLNYQVKLNVVLMKNVNDSELASFALLTRDLPIVVRFIEFMPFASNGWEKAGMVSYRDALKILEGEFGKLEKTVDDKNDTTRHFRVPGFQGTIGFISSMTDAFCGTCNRLRITADGNLKLCLHGTTEFSLRDALRTSGEEGVKTVVAAAVKKKHAKHAGMELLGERKEMNRPMIKIGG